MKGSLPSFVTPPTSVRTSSPNAALSSSGDVGVSSRTSCNRAAVRVARSSCISARIDAVLKVWMT